MNDLQKQQKVIGKDDLFVFYFSRTGFTDEDPPVLKLATRDASKNGPGPLSILEVRAEVGRILAAHKVCILDSGCGTVGLKSSPVLADGDAAQPAFDILSASQDDQFGAETSEGGVFASALLRALKSAESVPGIWMTDLFAQVATEIGGSLRGLQQRPKLMRLEGSAEVFWRK